MAVSTLRSFARTSASGLRQASCTVARVQYRGLATTAVKLSDNVNKPTMDDLSDKDKKRVSGGLPDEIPTDNKPTDWTSHANRPQDSKVPHFVQEVAPKAVEEALPESIHPTGGKPKKA